MPAAIRRHDHDQVRTQSSLATRHLQNRAAREPCDGKAPGALATPQTKTYQPKGLSMNV